MRHDIFNNDFVFGILILMSYNITFIMIVYLYHNVSYNIHFFSCIMIVYQKNAEEIVEIYETSFYLLY